MSAGTPVRLTVEDMHCGICGAHLTCALPEGAPTPAQVMAAIERVVEEHRASCKLPTDAPPAEASDG